MKSIKLLVLAVTAFLGTTAYAQTDNSFQFVDKDGNVIENGSTITVTNPEDDGMGSIALHTGLWVKNTTDKNLGANVEITLSQIDNGALSCCFPSSCAQIKKTGTYETQKGELLADSQNNFQTEWYPAEYGTCTATFVLKVYDVTYNKYGLPTYTYTADGPSVTVNFVYSNSTGINATEAAKDQTITEIYTLDGQKTNKLQKGINIVKYSNGKSAKITVQ